MIVVACQISALPEWLGSVVSHNHHIRSTINSSSHHKLEQTKKTQAHITLVANFATTSGRAMNSSRCTSLESCSSGPNTTKPRFEVLKTKDTDQCNTLIISLCTLLFREPHEYLHDVINKCRLNYLPQKHS